MERKSALFFVIPVFLTKTHQVDSLTERVLYACGVTKRKKSNFEIAKSKKGTK